MKLDALFGAEAAAPLLTVLLALSAVAVQRLDFDDFEKDVPRPWAAEIITGDIAPGLLVPTRKCVCRTEGVLQIGAARECPMPADAKKAFLASGVRVYDLGAQSRLVTEFSARGRCFSVTLSRRPRREDVVCSFEEDGREIAAIALPKGALPADFNFVAGVDGTADMTVKSLSDSQTRNMTKNSRILVGATTVTKSLYLKSDGGTAEATIDNLSTAIVDAERVAKAPPPWTASPDKTFDPVAAGWPLVFSDEFDGVAIDTNKWDLQGNEERKECASLSGDGRLLIKADYRRNSTNQLRTASLWSIPTFRYGYFEARVKFTRESGWWAAFWLCSHGIGNPFLDGFEIDIFEDYYTRIKNPGDGEHPKTLDHNLHVMGAGTMKSRNYNSTLPGSLDDFYVIGCKWTPYEVTIYLDGKAISSKSDHSPYDTVTFDAFRHGACNVPLHVIVSGQIMTKSWRCHDFTGFKIPETYEVDYVRVYGCPDTAEGMRPHGNDVFCRADGNAVRRNPDAEGGRQACGKDGVADSRSAFVRRRLPPRHMPSASLRIQGAVHGRMVFQDGLGEAWAQRRGACFPGQPPCVFDIRRGRARRRVKHARQAAARAARDGVASIRRQGAEGARENSRRPLRRGRAGGRLLRHDRTERIALRLARVRGGGWIRTHHRERLHRRMAALHGRCRRGGRVSACVYVRNAGRGQPRRADCVRRRHRRTAEAASPRISGLACNYERGGDGEAPCGPPCADPSPVRTVQLLRSRVSPHKVAQSIAFPALPRFVKKFSGGCDGS